jgi:Tol biopolymer transport system component
MAADAAAVSPDGRKLAVAVQSGGSQRGAIEVMTLATGAVTTWTAPRSGWATQLSWARHGRELGFFWQMTGRTARRRPACGC